MIAVSRLVFHRWECPSNGEGGVGGVEPGSVVLIGVFASKP